MKVAVKLVVLTGTLLTTSLFAQMTWTKATESAGWHRRCLAASVVFDNKVWVMGGDSTSLMGSGHFALLNDVWYSPDGANWALATASAGWSRRMSTPLVFGNKLWILGGLSDSALHNDVWSSTDGAQWTLATGSAGWHKRAFNASVVFNGMMWVMGGCDSFGQNGPRGMRNDVWQSTDGIHWTLATASADWSPRLVPTALAFGGEMWVMGGCDSIGDRDDHWPNDVWHSADGVHWTLATASAGWSTRAIPGALVFGGKMWVLGGMCGSGCSSDVWYSTDGAHWTQAVLEAPWKARYGLAVADCGGNMWVMGGADTISTMNDVWYSSGLDVAENKASPRPGTVDLNAQPNPFHNETRLAYSQTGACPAEVSIRDVSGRQVRLLVDGIPKPGPHSVVWNGRDELGRRLTPGVYFARLTCAGRSLERKLVLLE